MEALSKGEHKEERVRLTAKPAAARGSAGRLLPVITLLIFGAACAAVANPEGWAGPTRIDDTIYLTVRPGRLTAADADSFDVHWNFPASDRFRCGNEENERRRELDGIYGAPVATAELIYLGAYDGNVYAVTIETGECAWVFETGDPIIAALTLRDDRLFVGSTDGNLYVLDAASGSELDRFQAGAEIWSSPLATDDAVYVATVGGELHALDPDSLEPVWDEPFSVRSGLISDPILADGLVIVGGIGERLYAVDAATGEERWSFKAGNWFWSRPLFDDRRGLLYAPNLDGNVYALDLESGSPAWNAPFAAEAPIRSSPLLLNDVLIVVDRSGNVFGLDPDEGTLLWPGPALLGVNVLADPFVLDGEVLIVAQNGDVFRLNPEAGRTQPVEVRA